MAATPPALDEHALVAAVRGALTSAFPFGRAAPPCDDLISDSVVEELQAVGVPSDGARLRALLDDVLAGLGSSLDDAELSELSAALWRRLALAGAAASAAADAATANLPAGCCELCERCMPLTRHHLIPRSQHRTWAAKGWSVAQLSAVALVCRQCHSALHAAVDEATLAESHRCVEDLLKNDGVRRFVAWASRQRGRVDKRHDLQSRR